MDLPVPTHAFIGGSSGNMKDILKLLLSKNPGIRVVINCIALESVGEAMNCLNVLPFEQVDIAQVQVAKAKSGILSSDDGTESGLCDFLPGKGRTNE